MTNFDNTKFWQTFYKKSPTIDLPSSFAILIAENFLTKDSIVLELGCGDGRDAISLSSATKKYYGLDSSEAAILACKVRTDNNGSVTFIHADAGDSLSNIVNKYDINFVYSRFFLHAITEAKEDEILKQLDEELQPNSILAFEFRTSKDPLSVESRVVSGNVKATDHSRRFIDFECFVSRINNSTKWKILLCDEKAGWSKFGDDNPVLGRVIAQKIC